MPMLVMGVWKVWMGMHLHLMSVLVAMLGAWCNRVAMLMLMMFIVDVLVLMLHHFMHVKMFVALGQV